MNHGNRHAVPAHFGHDVRHAEPGGGARHEECAQTTAARWAAFQARDGHEHVRHIGAGDEFLDPGQAVTTGGAGVPGAQAGHVTARVRLGQRKGGLPLAAGQIGEDAGFERLAATGNDGPRRQVGAGDQGRGGAANAGQLFNDAHPQHHRRLRAAKGARKGGGHNAFGAQKAKSVPGKHVFPGHTRGVRANTFLHQLANPAQQAALLLVQLDKGVL